MKSTDPIRWPQQPVFHLQRRLHPNAKPVFYLTESLLERFNRHFHQMKLAGAPIENKSALLELALTFALEDLERGEQSTLLRTLNNTKLETSN